MAQYPVPQFIESEGRIIYFLTFRQFFILVGAGAICILFYYILPFSLFILLTIIIGVLAIAIAFLKIDGISIVTIITDFLKFSVSSKNYIWKKKAIVAQFQKIDLNKLKAISENQGVKIAEKNIELPKK